MTETEELNDIYRPQVNELSELLKITLDELNTFVSVILC